MAPLSSVQFSSPAFIAPLLKSPASRTSGRPCICRAVRDDESRDQRASNNKRDPIAEWVARARSQRRGRNNRANPDADSSATPNQAAAASTVESDSDSIFGASDSGTKKSGVRFTHENVPLSKEERQKWFDDLRRIAASDGDTDSDEIVVDTTNKAEPGTANRRSNRSRTRRRRNSKPSQLSKEDDEAKDGFSEAKIDSMEGAVSSDRTQLPVSFDHEKPTRRADSKLSTDRSGSGSGSVMNSSFAKLLEIARKGGSTNGRNKKPDFSSIRTALINTGTSEDRQLKSGDRKHSKNSKSSRSAKGTQLRKILDIALSPGDDADEKHKSQQLSENGKKSAKSTDDESDDTLLRAIGIKTKREKAPRRHFLSTRRVGGRVRKIHTPPADWAPMSNEEIALLRSESAPLAPSRSIGADPVLDCDACYGTGLEMCALCVGSGWVERLSRQTEKTKSSKLYHQLVEFWNQPNLVISSDGSAQCTSCNGIGKLLCSVCEGSGSALRKGFNPEDKYKEFDQFQTIDSPLGDDQDMEEVDLRAEFQEDEVGEQDEDEHMIYTGKANGFDFSLPHLERSALEQDTIKEDEEQIDENEFEFSNGVFNDGDIDFGSKPNRRPLLKRIRRTPVDYESISEQNAFAFEQDEDEAEVNEFSANTDAFIDVEDGDEDEDARNVVSDDDDDEDDEVVFAAENDDALIDNEDELEVADELEDDPGLLDDDEDDDLDEEDDEELEPNAILDEDVALEDDDDADDSEELTIEDDNDLELESVLPLFDEEIGDVEDEERQQ